MPIPSRPVSLAALLLGMALLSAAAIPHASAAIPTDGLVACYPFDANARDLIGARHGTIHGGTALTSDRHGRPGRAFVFNGTSGYIQIADADIFSLPTTGQFSISVWMRPDVLTFPVTQGTGYVHWMGKGGPNQHEWTFRMYNFQTSDNRSNRTSFYLFNPTALPGMETNLGAGSYVQEPVTAGVWIHYVAVIDYATDSIKWYKNGVLKDQDTFRGDPYYVAPTNGTAPVRIGTRDTGSFFKGAIDEVCFYNRLLTLEEIRQLRDNTAELSTPPPAILTGPTQLREGDPLKLTANTGTTFASTYRWFREGNLVAGATQPILTGGTVGAASAGHYRFEALDGDGNVILSAETAVIVRPATTLTTQPQMARGSEETYTLVFAPDFVRANFWRVQSTDDLTETWINLLGSADGITWTAEPGISAVSAAFDHATGFVTVVDARPMSSSAHRFWRVEHTIAAAP